MVDTSYYNFTALNAPDGSPEPFGPAIPSTWSTTTPAACAHPERLNAHGESDVLLRTQTSGVQIHAME